MAAWQIEGEKAEVVTDFLFLGSRITVTVDSDCNHEIRRQLLLGRQSTDKPIQCVEKQRHYSADKGLYSQGYGLPSGHVWLWELDHKTECHRIGAFKLWCWRIPQSPSDSKEVKPVNCTEDQSWIFIGRTDAEAPVYWSFDMNRQLIRKVSNAGKDGGQKEKRVSEDEIAGGYHWCKGHELGQTLGDAEEQGDLACCSPWGCRGLDMPELLKNSNNLW